MSIFYIQKKYVPKNSQKIPNLAKFWNWHKTLKEQEKSIFDHITCIIHFRLSI